MVNINEIAPFPNVGVQLLKEDEHIAVWQEMFEPDTPTSPHRHMRDYIAIFHDVIFPFNPQFAGLARLCE